MELFKTRDLKKMYEIFVSESIFKIFECKYCNKEKCMYHFLFDCSCKQCRETRCKKCISFDTELEILLNAANKDSAQYIFNFVRDFFAVSNETMQFFFDFDNTNIITEEDIKCIAWNLRKINRKGTTVESLKKTQPFIIHINRRSNKGIKFNL